MRKLLAILALAVSAQAGPNDLCRATEACVPPATYTFAGSPPPFNAPVRFAGEVRAQNGEVRWAFATIAPLSCSPAQMIERAAYGRICRAAVGEVVFTMARFRP